MKALILAAALAAMSWAASAATVAVSARPVVVTARPMTVVRPATPVIRNVPTTNYRGTSTTILPVYVPLMIHNSSTGARESVEVATPLLTVCTRDQYAKARAWQQDCLNVNEVGAAYCPLLSYFRFCKEASPEDVQGLKPAAENYRHVFMAN